MLASGIKGIRIQHKFESAYINWFQLHAAAPWMPRSLLRGYAAAVLLWRQFGKARECTGEFLECERTRHFCGRLEHIAPACA